MGLLGVPPMRLNSGEPMARSRAKADDPKLADSSDLGVLALHRPIPHGLKRAIDYIRGHVNGNISIADLVAHCGIPERTLRTHFRAFIAVSPLTFWRQLRLAAARAHLLEGSNDTSITEVAARFGFGHFGRFAQDYRRHFGEPPSETLRRSRLERREREKPTPKPCPYNTSSIPVAPSSSRDRPSIAVLPLQNSATDPDCRAFGEYVAEGIATVLCRVRSLSVTVPKPSRVRMADPQKGARDVGTRYLLAGRIAQSGNRVRVIIRLLDAETDVHVWGTRTTD